METDFLFKFDFKKYNDLDLSKPFFILQKEAVVADETNTSIVDIYDVEYACLFLKQEDWDVNKPTIIIPIKDDVTLLSATLSNLTKNKVKDLCNIIVVDDRSGSYKIKILTEGFNLSYLRVDNPKGFNFSMLNNIAALASKITGTQELILWNSDLWDSGNGYLQTLLNKHRENKSVISGTRLIYPPKSISFQNEEEFKKSFEGIEDWYEKIQFGGSIWIKDSNINALIPIHHRRFRDKDDLFANCDKVETFITGAFQILEKEWFFSVGGLNPSLAKNTQDVDICLKALENNRNVFYFGKEFFYHDESIVMTKEGKMDKQMYSDHLLFARIWNGKTESLIF